MQYLTQIQSDSSSHATTTHMIVHVHTHKAVPIIFALLLQTITTLTRWLHIKARLISMQLASWVSWPDRTQCILLTRVI